jgi:hypothetical protein
MITPSKMAEAVENIATFLELLPHAPDDTQRADPFTAIVPLDASKNDRALFESFVTANRVISRPRVCLSRADYRSTWQSK